MAETAACELTLSRLQRSQWYAQIMTYMYSLTLKPAAPRDRATMDVLQGIGIRLFGLWNAASEGVAFALNAEEVQALREMLGELELLYAQWPGLASSALALEHLAACRGLLEEAERQGDASRQPNREECVE